MIASRRLSRARLLMLAAGIVAIAGAATSEGAPTLGQEVKLLADNGAAFDGFGWSVAISGNTAIVGTNGRVPGAVYIFVRNGDKWDQQTTLTGPSFGRSVAISGNTALVGASNSVYVFVRTGTQWKQQGNPLTVSDSSTELFGYSVAISGDTAVVGSPYHKNGSQAFAGAAYIFVRNGEIWSPGQKLPVNDRNPDPQTGDGFGFSVGISGDTAIIGAPTDNVFGSTSTHEGSAYVYVRNAGAWTEQKWLTVDPTRDDASRQFGYSVGISGDVAIGGSQSYQAFVFERSGSTWSAPKDLTPDAGEVLGGDRYGQAVALSGDFAIVGADADAVLANRGAVYLFQRSGGSWSEIEKLQPSDRAGHQDVFGESVAISGATAIAGAPLKDVGANDGQGEAYIYQMADADGDSLPDEWEKNGITVDANGAVRVGNVGGGVFIDLPKMGADPRHKDIFVHLDWMQESPGGEVFKPNPTAIEMVVDSSALAPRTNPDSKMGVNLHVDFGPDSVLNPATGEKWGTLSEAGEVTFQNVFDPAGSPTGETFQNALLAARQFHFTPGQRSPVFHYALFCKHVDNSQPRPGGLGFRPGTDFVVASSNLGTPITQAGTFMHELGHNLGFAHGGGDEINFKPNYLSIMNYRFQNVGTLKVTGQRSLDYSGDALATLDERNLNEPLGIGDPLKHMTFWNKSTRPDIPLGSNQCLAHPDSYYKLFAPGSELDWDCDGAKDFSQVAADINGDGVCVLPNPDTDLHTTPAGDDKIFEVPAFGERRHIIVSGPNRTCETTADPRDTQKSPPGFQETDLLTGFDDWANLVFDGGGVIGQSGANQTARTIGTVQTETLPKELPSELSFEEVNAEMPPALVAQEALAPHDVVSVSGQAGSFTLSFDGSASIAVNATIVKWEWKFGDGTTGTGAKVMHTYNAAGKYFVTLTVTDSKGRVNLVPLLTRVTVPYKPSPTPTPTPTPTVTPTPGKANLTPYKPAGWADKIVVSKAKGTHTDSSPLLSSDKLYVDFAVINNGGTGITTSFKNKLFVDDVVAGTFTTNPPLNSGGFFYVEDFPVGPLPAGQHSIKLTADANGEVAEANEQDNEYTRVVSVAPTPPPISQTYTVKNTSDSGPDSLRQALLDADTHPNGSGGIDRIVFNIPGGGVKTIKPATALPPITEAVLIDGYTQPGASANTLPVGNNAIHLIELNIASAGFAVGLDVRSAGNTVRGLVINRWGYGGIQIRSGDNNVIEGCFIGTNAAGAAAAPEAATLHGGTPAISIYQGNGNRIGGTTPAARNVIVGNDIGILIGNDSLNGVADTLIQGNYIGTNAAGSAALNNQAPISDYSITGTGIYVGGSKISNTTIGGTQPGAGNVISGNGPPGDDGLSVRGILIGSGFDPMGDVTIQGNLIGTNATGTAALPNSNGGIFVVQSVSHLLIGGPTAAARNIISGNGTGLDSLGVLDEVYVPAGVKIYADTTNGIAVQGNYIGVGADGLTPIPNRISGIEVKPFAGKSYTIGGTNPGEGNVIAGNGQINGLHGHGVQIGYLNIDSYGTVSILGNSIFANEGLGIDLVGYPENAFRVTRNDPGNAVFNALPDADTGPNGLQNHPVLGSVAFAGGNVTIEGTLSSTATKTYHVEFFANKALDPSRFGEGQFLLGSSPVTTDASGNAAFRVSFPAPAGARSVSATASDPNGNTSEFAAMPGQLLNISTRLRVQTGDNALIGGFIVTGTQSKKVIVRAIGPALGVPGELADPTLELHDATGAIASNDDWRSTQEQEIIATTIPPRFDLESAIVRTLNPGAYTAIVRGKNNKTGIGLVEAYDLHATPDSKVANISTRGFVDTGDNVLIGGFIVGPDGGWAINGPGPGPINTKVIVRAIGPSLALEGKLADPTLELHNTYGDSIATNDNWRSDQEAEIIATTIPPSSNLEAAIVRTLPPGPYTAIVRGKNNATGIALVEVYALN